MTKVLRSLAEDFGLSYTKFMSETTIHTEDSVVPDGAFVKYHGSLMWAHGFYLVVESGEPFFKENAHLYPGGVAYQIRPANEDGTSVSDSPVDDLCNVRASSFSVESPRVANPKRTQVK